VHVDTTARVSGCSGIECGDCVMNVDQYRAVTNTDITDSDQPADHHAGDVIESRDNYRHTYSRLHRVTRPVYCVTYAESEPYCHSILFVCLSVGHSTTYSLPRLIDHNQIWSARVYTCPWTRVSLFGSPVSHTFGARGKYAKFRL